MHYYSGKFQQDCTSKSRLLFVEYGKLDSKKTRAQVKVEV